MHRLLRVGSRSSGEAAFEAIHVDDLGARRYKVLHSPGLAYGIAADDEIEVEPDGTFMVLKRGGNVAVRVYWPDSHRPPSCPLVSTVQHELGGRLDGRKDHGLAFTVPATSGFSNMERVFDEYITSDPEATWEYGNVYDENGNSLNWWQSAA
jgi:hypothetical protein